MDKQQKKNNRSVFRAFFLIALVVVVIVLIAKTNKEINGPNKEHSANRTNTTKQPVSEFYLRIGFFNDIEQKPLNPRCRMWIRGFGDFYPVQQSDWQYGGTTIEKAGPFDINSENVIYFYPDYPNETKEINVPFKYSSEMNPSGSVRDMVTITIEDEKIMFTGLPISNAGEASKNTFTRE